jgi:hypothetical protein
MHREYHYSGRPEHVYQGQKSVNVELTPAEFLKFMTSGLEALNRGKVTITLFTGEAQPRMTISSVSSEA